MLQEKKRVFEIRIQILIQNIRSSANAIFASQVTTHFGPLSVTGLQGILLV